MKGRKMEKEKGRKVRKGRKRRLAKKNAIRPIYWARPPPRPESRAPTITGPMPTGTHYRTRIYPKLEAQGLGWKGKRK